MSATSWHGPDRPFRIRVDAVAADQLAGDAHLSCSARAQV
jgi:hypothetical protein